MLYYLIYVLRIALWTRFCLWDHRESSRINLVTGVLKNLKLQKMKLISSICVCVFKGKEDQCILAGKYLRLEQISTGYVVMSNTPMECATNKIAYEMANGSVLMAGLGMGMILEAIYLNRKLPTSESLRSKKILLITLGASSKTIRE